MNDKLKQEKEQYTVIFVEDRYKQLGWMAKRLGTKSKLRVVLKGLDVLKEVFNGF